MASSARVFAYDRAGLGKSDPSPAPRTIEQMADELHQVLLAARVPAPWVLVGHSLGGAIAEVFAHRYPREVAGLVLVDPEDGRLDDMLRSRMPAQAWDERKKAIEKAMPGMPAPVRAELEAYRASAALSADAFEVGKLPVVLLTGTKKNPEFPGNPLEQDVKRELHEKWLATAPGAKHVLVPQSRHYIQNDAPTEVVDAVKDVLSRAADRRRGA
jgi:pimeloyl-ACP methyl ester carboxylesterase